MKSAPESPGIGLKIIFAMVALLPACGTDEYGADHPDDNIADRVVSQNFSGSDADEKYSNQRLAMVERQLAGRDITNQRVLETMRNIPRHKFVPDTMRDRAYTDSPLPIGERQTISQPYIVALMTQLADPQSDDKALDVGTGSGYQAAVLAELVKDVYSVEIVDSLARQAKERLKTLGYKNVHVRHGDGYHGWESEAPFDLIILAAAPDHVPPKLVEQLAPGGKLILPVGDFFQTLMVVEKQADGTVNQKKITSVAFVPMTGDAKK